MHRQLCSRGEAINFIGVTINSEIFNHGPLWLSFRPIKDFNVEDLSGLLSSAIQSANNFDSNDRLSISCAIVEGVAGGGRTQLTQENVKKKSILSIKNDDNLCRQRTNTNRSVQKGAAEELLNLANVQVPIRGCGLEEIHRFQIFFATCAIALVVYSFRNFAISLGWYTLCYGHTRLCY